MQSVRVKGGSFGGRGGGVHVRYSENWSNNWVIPLNKIGQINLFREKTCWCFNAVNRVVIRKHRLLYTTLPRHEKAMNACFVNNVR